MTDTLSSTSEDEFTPLNREEFCASVSGFHRRVAWGAVLLVIAFLLLFWVMGNIADAMNDAGVPEESPWRYLLIGVLALGSLSIVWGFSMFTQYSHLKCPHCSHPLHYKNDSCCAIVTGRCPSCAMSLFEKEPFASEETPHAPDDSLLSRDDLSDDLENARNAALRPTLIWAISGFNLVVIGGLFGPWLSDVAASQLGELWTPFVAPALLAPGIIVGTWTLAVWSRHCRSSRPCPHCAAPISASDVATSTGNCSACGRQAVRDPVPGIEPSDEDTSEPSWPTIEFRRLAKPRHDRLWIGCLVGGGFAAIWGILFLSMLKAQGYTHVSFRSSWEIFLGFGGIILFQLGGVFLWHWYSARRIRCPECQSELLQFYRLVVSSKRCYHCGATVIGEPTGDVQD